MAAQVEKRFMEWMLRDNARPGRRSTNSSWPAGSAWQRPGSGVPQPLPALRAHREAAQRRLVFKGFTGPASRSSSSRSGDVRATVGTGLRGPTRAFAAWQQIDALREEHLALLKEIEHRYHDFSDLDSRFHRLINSAAPNRFIEGFCDVISLIFHYHYQWNKHDERERNEVAIQEHLTYIEALLSRNVSIVELGVPGALDSGKGDADTLNVGARSAIDQNKAAAANDGCRLASLGERQEHARAKARLAPLAPPCTSQGKNACTLVCFAHVPPPR